MTSLSLLQSEMRKCRRCVEAGYIAEANPLSLGSASAEFMVIGQAPSRLDNETNSFYVGPAGRKLRGWLAEAGLSEEDQATRVYFAAMTRCFPGRLPGSSKDRLPSRAEQKLCRSWLDTEMELLKPRVVILFGGLSIETFLGKAPLTERIGFAFEKDGRTYVPLPHSSGASTWLNLTENQERLRQAIRTLAETLKP
ncbi:MAG: uracil-DNA glycosylase family protein [Armatimonas sp.]